jgi:hypothetical protein
VILRSPSIRFVTPPRRLSRVLRAAALLLALPLGSAAAQARASIDLLVSDGESGAPLAGASVRVDGVAQAVSDSAGKVWLTMLLPGRHRLEVMMVGRQPVAPDLELLEGQLLNLEVVLDPLAVALDPVDVRVSRATAVSPAQRSGAGRGRRLGRRELERYGPIGLGELLARLMREEHGGTRCIPQVIADGIVLAAGSVNSLPVQDLEAVEVYTVANTPPEFSGTRNFSCGMVGVWTRHD